jgi:hypothetical protein
VGTRPGLIFCASNGPSFARAAVEEGWLYGARLPATVYAPPYFADQDWRRPDREAYMRALARHRPAMATVLDWEREEQLPEVLSWAEEAVRHVRESILVVPKVVGGVGLLPRRVGGRRVVLAYSVPTSYGGSPLPLWELWGWPVHLLGGSPQEQMRLWRYLRRKCDVISVDGNMAGQQSRRGRFWSPVSGPKGRWTQLRDAGDARTEGAYLEAFRRSLRAIRSAWDRAAGRG